MKRVIFLICLFAFAVITLAGWKHSIWTGDNRKDHADLVTATQDIDSLEAVESEVVQGTFGTADLTDTLAGAYVAGALVTVSPVDSMRTDSNGLWIESVSTTQIIIKRNNVQMGAQKYNAHIIRVNNP